MGLMDRIREFRGPSKADLQDQIKHLQHQVGKRFNPVPSGVAINYNRFEYEQNEKLLNSDRWDTLEELARDPHVHDALRNVELPLINGEWELEAASDKPADMDMKELIEANLLRSGSDKYGSEFYVQESWKAQRLPEILTMLENGFSMFAKTVKIVNGKRVYDRLHWLEPSSVDPHGWVLDDEDNLMAIRRTYSAPSGRVEFWDELPAEHILLYVWDFKGARFEGTPFTRPMYGAKMRKEFKQKMSAILAQKLGSPVPYGWYPPGFPKSAIPTFDQFVRSLRGTAAAEAYMVGPQGDDGKSPDVGYAGAEHNVERGFGEIIDQENREIGHAGANTGSNLGETESGSRSLGDSKGLREMVLVEAAGEIIGEFETHGLANLQGAIEELYAWNKGSGTTEPPRLKVAKTNPFALRQAWQDLTDAWAAGIIPKTPEARRQIVETHLGLNLPDEQYDVEEPAPFSPNMGPDGQPVPPANPDEAPDADASTDRVQAPRSMALESSEKFRARIAPWLEPVEDAPTGGRFRARTRLEVEAVNLEAVSSAIRVGERDFTVELRAIHREMIDELMGRLRAGKITPRNLEGQRRSAYSKARSARNRVMRVFAKVGEAGWRAVQGEVDAR